MEFYLRQPRCKNTVEYSYRKRRYSDWPLIIHVVEVPVRFRDEGSATLLELWWCFSGEKHKIV